LGDLCSGAKERIVAPLRRAQELGIPYMMLAVTAGPFKGRSLSKRAVGRILRGAERIVVREDVSLQHLRATYPMLDNVSAAIDIVYALPCALDNKPRELLDRYRRFMAEVPRDAIGASVSLAAAHGLSHRVERAQYVEKMLRLCDHAIGVSQSELVLFPHLELDMPILQQIKAGSRYSERIKVLPADFDADLQRDALSRLQFFIASRYHPTIFAVQAHVPLLCVKDEFRTEGMLQDIGLGALPCCWWDEPLEVAARAFDACWSGRHTQRDVVIKAEAAAAAAAKVYGRALEQAHAVWVDKARGRSRRSA